MTRGFPSPDYSGFSFILRNYAKTVLHYFSFILFEITRSYNFNALIMHLNYEINYINIRKLWNNGVDGGCYKQGGWIIALEWWWKLNPNQNLNFYWSAQVQKLSLQSNISGVLTTLKESYCSRADTTYRGLFYFKKENLTCQEQQ